MDGLTEGRVVHFVTADGEHRAATVVKVWDHGKVNLQVAIDGSNDTARIAPYAHFEHGQTAPIPSHVWVTSVDFDEDSRPPRTWHWIEKA